MMDRVRGDGSTDDQVPAAFDRHVLHSVTVERALARLSLDEKAALLGGQDEWSLPAMPHIGLRSLVMSDGPIGVRGVRWTPDDPSIALPCPTALAATWDPEIAHRAGRVLAEEARDKGVHVLLGPTINLHRTPIGGRNFECYSEDPVLTGQIAVGYIHGVQSGGVATTAKHFVANEAETDRFTVDNVVSERALRELYLAPFESVVKAGAWGLMSAYNSVNGSLMTEHAGLQRDVLRQEWGFDGFVVSDWLAARSTINDLLGGMDVAMPGPSTVYGPRLAAAVRAGEVNEELVDDAVRRVLLLAVRVGCLETSDETIEVAAADTGADVVAREIATSGCVLLENRNGTLPLNRNAISKIAIIGSAAAQPQIQGGGAAQVFPKYAISPLDGLRAALDPATRITHALGAAILDEMEVAAQGFELRAIVRDAAGSTLADVALPSGEVQWTGSDFPRGTSYDQLHSVELTGTFTPRRSGSHQFGTKAIAHVRLTVGDTTLFDGVEEAQGGGDPLEAFFSRPVHRGYVDLQAGTPIDVSLFYVGPKMQDGQNQSVVVSLTHRDPQTDPETLLSEAETAAKNADVAVVIVSTTPTVESEGSDRKSLKLPGRQDELVRRVSAANRRTIVVVNCGAPVELPWRNDVAAVLLTWFPGQEGGNAVADVLLGLEEPGGRLPMTWPASLADAPISKVTPTDGHLPYTEELLIGYRAWDQHDKMPAYWFGHGHGYTDWRYERLQVTIYGSARPDYPAEATVTLCNTGTRRGREVVQIYLAPALNHPDAASNDPDRPDRWLAGFATVHAAPGDQVTATVELPRRAFESWSSTAGWTRPAESYELSASHSAGDVRLTAEVPAWLEGTESVTATTAGSGTNAAPTS